MKKPLKIPKFNSEDLERDYWSSINLADYLEPSDFEKVYFPSLKPTSKPISIRIPDYMIYSLKEKANAINIPYQSLIKIYISKGLKESLT